MEQSQKHTILVLTREPEEYEKRLLSFKLPGATVIVPKTEEEILEHIGDADVLFANPPIASRYLHQAKSLVWLQSTFAGIDALTAPDLRKNYILTNVKDTYGTIIAEYVMGYILYFEKDIAGHLQLQREKIWKQRNFVSLEGKVLALLGTGSIGKDIARLAKAFGMRVVGYKKSPGDVEFFDAVYTGDELKEFLAQGDFVVSILPKTTETDNVMNAETFACMKPSAMFMNVGRGNAVNEDDLVQALRQKKIARAVLDVFQTEPLSPENPLWCVENLFITPHVSGYFVNDRIFEIFEENYRRFLAGEELLYTVNLQKGY